MEGFLELSDCTSGSRRDTVEIDRLPCSNQLSNFVRSELGDQENGACEH